MKPPEDQTAGSLGSTPGPGHSGERETGLPFLRTWRAVYAFVLAVFALWVGLLIALSRMFS
ncbi:MAG: hypothetical protein ABSA45_06730 [Verrucomicrobiota bacterium]|jgi:hypothetical protein